jgi:hypothetical protein
MESRRFGRKMEDGTFFLIKRRSLKKEMYHENLCHPNSPLFKRGA